MTALGLFAVALGSVLGFALGIWLGAHRRPSRPPRLAFYPRAQTGQALRRRLFGGRIDR